MHSHVHEFWATFGLRVRYCCVAFSRARRAAPVCCALRVFVHSLSLSMFTVVPCGYQLDTTLGLCAGVCVMCCILMCYLTAQVLWLSASNLLYYGWIMDLGSKLLMAGSWIWVSWVTNGWIMDLG